MEIAAVTASGIAQNIHYINCQACQHKTISNAIKVIFVPDPSGGIPQLGFASNTVASCAYSYYFGPSNYTNTSVTTKEFVGSNSINLRDNQQFGTLAVGSAALPNAASAHTVGVAVFYFSSFTSNSSTPAVAWERSLIGTTGEFGSVQGIEVVTSQTVRAQHEH
jgi:hypothetical protein